MARRRAGASDAGFGLLEVVVAMALLLTVMLPVSYLLASVIKQTSYNRTSVAAGEVAESILTNAPAQLSLWMNGQWPTAGAPTVPSGCTSEQLACTLPQPSATQAGIAYSPTLELSWAVISTLNKDVCTSGQVPQVVNASVTVTWDHGRTFAEETNIQLPYIPSNVNMGYLAVQVNGATGQPQHNVEVSYTSTAPGATTQTVPTDQYGCAFVEVPQGQYNIGVGPPVGSTATYVDDQEVQSPLLANVTVPAAAITQKAFNYDQAATVSLHYPSVTAVDGGVSCPSDQLCLASGQGAGGATVDAYSSSSWSTLTVPGLARLGSVVCPQDTRCYGVGSSDASGGTPQALIVSFTKSNGTWSGTTTTPPAPTGTTASGLTSIACPQADQCYASGYTVSGGSSSGWIVSFDGTTWSQVATSSSTDVPSLACPSTQTCLLVNLDGASSSVDTFTTSSSSFAAQTVSPTPTSLASVSCPFSASTANAPCFVEGTSAGGPIDYVTEDSGTTWVSVALPAGTATGPPACTSLTACVVAGVNGTSAIVDLTATTPAPPQAPTPLAWSATAATLDASLTAALPVVTSVVCPSASECIASGQQTGSGAPAGLLAESTDGGVNWSAVALPAPPAGSTAATFMTGVACEPSGACVAAAESTGRSIVYDTSGGSWIESTFDPATSAGGQVLATGLSTTVSNPGITGSGWKEMNPSVPGSNPVSVTPLYPYPSGYDVWPGDCQSQSVSPLPITPATAGGTNTADIQLGYLPVRIVGSNGQPIPGATLSITELATTGVGGGTETYTLPDSGSDGLSEAGTPLGNYTLTVVDPIDGKTTTTTVAIAVNSVTTLPPTSTSTVSYPSVLTVPVA